MQDIFVVAAKRTAIGSFMGGLSSLSSIELGSHVIKGLLAETKLDPAVVSEVIFGQVLTGGLGQNPVRQAAINAGLSQKTPAWGISMVCGSGLKAIASAMHSIALGYSDIVVAGGQESMSQAMHALYARPGIKMGDGKLIDMMSYDGLTDAFSKVAMGVTAENLVKKYDISRKEQDEFAFKSHQKAAQARESGKFHDEILPLSVKSRKQEIVVDQDEGIKADSNIEGLAKLRAVFDKEGSVTAGNSSTINDGAAGVILASADAVKKYNLTPIARVSGFGQAGVDPNIMGIGPVEAVKVALAKAGWGVSDLDLIEANEAFAAQAIAVNKELKWDLNKVNVNGGAIALGHPIGASGARVAVTLLHEMKRRNSKKAIATLCIGGGMGVALCFEGV